MGADASVGLVWACSRGHRSMVGELLQVDEDGILVHPTIVPSVDNNAPLRDAAQEGRVDILALLLTPVQRWLDNLFSSALCTRGLMPGAMAATNEKSRDASALASARMHSTSPTVL